MGELVSIIVPCFNAEQWIEDCVTSALAQSYDNIEVIVIDDGSLDNSFKVLKHFGNRIKAVKTSNRGGAAARNSGLKLANGSWVQFLDADDVLLPGCIEDKLSASAHSDVIQCCRVELMNGQEPWSLPPYWKCASYDARTILTCGAPATPAPLHRRETLIKIGGFREELSCGQEFDLHLRLVLKLGMRFNVMDSVGVLIRRRSDSTSRSAGARMPLAVGSAILECISDIYCSSDSRELSSLAAQQLTKLARTAWQRGAREAAEELAAKARTIDKDWALSAYRNSLTAVIARILGFGCFERIRSYCSLGMLAVH